MSRPATGAPRAAHERQATPPFGYNEIASLLPHRFPFQFIDRVLEFEDGRRIVALKNVSINEPFFPRPFPRAAVDAGRADL